MTKKLENLAVLVVEANARIRVQLRTMLDGFKVGELQFVHSANAAIRRLRERHFDLILCEYDLGEESQDGQHLLEDLRTQNVISPQTLFVMISSERNYERVVGAAELAPDDYILKPLTPGTLQARLERSVRKREVFLPAYRLIESGAFQEALDHCAAAEKAAPAHRRELMRLRAEIHIAQRQFAEADAVYERVLALGEDTPWARLGHARMLLEREEHEEAEALLATLIADHPYYLDAYDYLARAHRAANRPGEACTTLSQAIERSPHRVGRLRDFGTTAVLAGRFDEAEKAQREVVRKGKLSEFRDPEDHLRLVRTQLSHGRAADARETLVDLEKSMGTHPATRACTALGHALIHQRSGDGEAARLATSLAALAAMQSDALSVAMKHEIISACLENGLEREGIELASNVLRNAGDAETVTQTRAVLNRQGRADLSPQIEAQLHAEVRGYIEDGARKAKAGDYDGAVSEMMSALRKMPGNPHVSFNAALALLRHIENKGWNERLAAQARALIARTRRLDPANPRLDAITGFMQGLAGKHAERRETANEPRVAREKVVD